MKKRTASLLLVSAVGVGVASTTALTPALAANGVTTAASHRLTELKGALTGLVKDGTLTQAQADKVATTLDSTLPKGFGRGGRGPGLSVAATVLGMTEDELRTALGSNKSLAQVAAAKGIDRATLISKLVAAAKTRIAADVTSGRLTQAEADERLKDLTARITEKVDRVGLPMRRQHDGTPPADAPAGAPAPDGTTQG